MRINLVSTENRHEAPMRSYVNGCYFLHVYFMLTRIHALYPCYDDVLFVVHVNLKWITHTHTEKINKFTFCSLLSFQHMRISHLLHLYVNAFSYFDFVLWRFNFWLIIICVHTTQYKVIFVSIVANGCLAIFPVFSCSFPFYVAVCKRLHQLKCGLWPQINGTMLLLRACFSFFCAFYSTTTNVGAFNLCIDFFYPIRFTYIAGDILIFCWYFQLRLVHSSLTRKISVMEESSPPKKIMCAVPSYQCQV